LSDLVERGIAAVRSGDRLTARGLLVRAVLADPGDERAWVWLSGAVDTDEERLACLVKVLAINPSHDAARRGAAALRRKGVGLPSSAEGAPAADPGEAGAGLRSRPELRLRRANSLDQARTIVQLEPRKRHALRGFSLLIRQQLEEGRKRGELVSGLVRRGFPLAAVEELVDEVARPLNRRSLKRYRSQVVRGGSVALGALVGILVLSLARVPLAALYYLLSGTVLVGIIDLAAGVVGWVYHRV
jgi:hypothetical protein